MNSPNNRSERIPYRFSLTKHRLAILHRMEDWLETPMAILSGVWLYLMIVELVSGSDRTEETAATVIWVIFLLDFALRFSLAPAKLRYLRVNWLTAVSLLLPALRMFRVVRIFRALGRLRGLQLVRILGSINRGMKTLGKTMRRHGFGYVIALTVIVTLAGAAGMEFFERGAGPSGLNDFWAALWWTAMLMTTMGSEYWPRTAEGRALCLLLAVYAFAMFGYVTGTIATYFIGQDTAERPECPPEPDSINLLREEIAALRRELGTIAEDRTHG